MIKQEETQSVQYDCDLVHPKIRLDLVTKITKLVHFIDFIWIISPKLKKKNFTDLDCDWKIIVYQQWN